MSNTLATAAATVLERLFKLAQQDAELRTQLRQIATEILEATETLPEFAADATFTVEAPATAAAIAEVPATPAAETVLPPDSTKSVVRKKEPAEVARESKPTWAPLPELTLGRTLRSEPPRPAKPFVEEAENDLAVLESRCRLKAEAARWAATRRRMLADGARYETEIEPQDKDIIQRAKQLPGCFLWMCHSSAPSPADLSLFEEVGGCFEAVAKTLALIQHLQDDADSDPADFEAALDLLAEAQSAVRIAIAAIDDRTDTDQKEVFYWLKKTASEKQIFIQKYMRSDSQADPAQWRDLLARVGKIDERSQTTKTRRNQRKKLLGKVRHKAAKIASDPAQAAGEWESLIATVVELVAGGLPPSNRELREMLGPVIDDLPDVGDLPHEFELVVREIDTFQAANSPAPETTNAAQPTKEIREAAELLSGKSLVLIGGDERPGAAQAIKTSFGLQELIWIQTRAHESIESFAPYVARADVAAVLLMIRWASHSYGEVKRFCDSHGKPLVRLPGGYNPNQIAAQVLSQASKRLK